MRHVQFDPYLADKDPDIPESQKAQLSIWMRDATDAIREAIEHYERTGQRPKENDTIWKKHKDWLLQNKFHHKCAYCEQSLKGADRHAEHWRPKRGVVFNLTENETDGPHPGYFWLAYSWENLLPSCSHCNAYDGKRNAFPTRRDHIFLAPLLPDEVKHLKGEAIESKINPGYYYLSSRDLDDLEEPDLLHPYYDEPLEHLVFDSRGLISFKTPKGKASIEVFNLDREDLNTKRQLEQSDADFRFYMARRNAVENGKSYRDALEVAWDYVRGYTSGKLPFSCAVVAALEETFQQPVHNELH